MIETSIKKLYYGLQVSDDWVQTGFENLFLDLFFANSVYQGNAFKLTSKIHLPDNAAVVTRHILDDYGIKHHKSYKSIFLEHSYLDCSRALWKERREG